MAIENHDESILADDQLDEIYKKIQGQIPGDSMNAQVLRARRALGMIERVRNASQKETPRHGETVENNDQIRASESGTDTLELPQQIGRFTIRRAIGSGGFGMVLLAYDPGLDREVALKIPRPEAIATAELRARFLREGRAAASLAHPNIVPVFESGQTNSICFLASKYIPGETLAEFQTNHSERLTPRTVASIVARLAEAMGHAHQRGVLHRDLKPANILVENTEATGVSLADRVRITDFGLALIVDDQLQTRTGAMVGTPAYMSPEQSGQREPVGPASDIWGLGAVMYQLLSGRPPFQNADLIATVEAIRNREPKSLTFNNRHVSKDLNAVCLKCLEKNPRNRYADAFELERDLRRYLEGHPVLARSVSGLDRLVRWTKRNPMAAALLSVISISALVVSLLLVQSEQLRQVASDRKNEVVKKTEQLHHAIDRLFVAIASTPEIKLGGLDPFRRKLYSEASSLYAQLVGEVPDDTDLFLGWTESSLGFAVLTNSLGEKSAAREIADEVLEAIVDRQESVALSADQQTALVHAQVDSLLLKLKLNETAAEANQFQDLVLDIIETPQFQGELYRTKKAIALSDVAGSAVLTREHSFANQKSDQALMLWREIQDEAIENATVFQKMLGCYTTAITVAAKSENLDDGLPLAIEALQIFGVEDEDFEALEPETVSNFCSILTNYGFLLRDQDIQQGIRFVETARNAILPVALAHPLVSDLQSRSCEIGYKHALLHFIATDYATAETLFEKELESSKSLSTQFPESRKFNKNTSNCLWMLGLIHKKHFDYKKQLTTLKETREMIERDPEVTLQTRLRLAGLNGEIGFCKSKLGDGESGYQLIVAACKELESVIVEDSANGEAKRFLWGNLEFASETARRIGRYEDAKTHFDRMIEIQGAQPTNKQLSAQIELAVGLGDDVEALKLLSRYTVEVPKLRNSDLFHDAKMFSHALAWLEKIDHSDASDRFNELETSIVTASIQGLEQLIKTSGDATATIAKIEEEPQLAPLRQHLEYNEWMNSWSKE